MNFRRSSFLLMIQLADTYIPWMSANIYTSIYIYYVVCTSIAAQVYYVRRLSELPVGIAVAFSLCTSLFFAVACASEVDAYEVILSQVTTAVVYRF